MDCQIDRLLGCLHPRRGGVVLGWATHLDSQNTVFATPWALQDRFWTPLGMTMTRMTFQEWILEPPAEDLDPPGVDFRALLGVQDSPWSVHTCDCPYN